jgi:hypothetical protein
VSALWDRNSGEWVDRSSQLPALGADHLVAAVTDLDGRLLVAVDTRSDPNGPPTEWDIALLRLSPDGQWFEEASFGGSGEQFAYDVCAFAHGRAAVVGADSPHPGRKVPAIWLRDASGGWRRETMASAGWQGHLSSCVGVGSTLVAVGTADGHAVAWSVRGGTVTSRRISDSPSGANAVIALDGRFVALGNLSINNVTNAAMWSSSNGDRWTPLTLPSSLRVGSDTNVHAAAAEGSTIVAAGSDGAAGAVFVLRAGT